MEPDEENPPIETPVDPAAAAFEALREEVALVRRAVAGLAAERAAIENPDYIETLGQIARAQAVIANNLKTLAGTPALRLAASDWGREIAAAGDEARRFDRETLMSTVETLQRTTRDMTASLRSARSANDQREWLLLTAAGCFVAGMLFLVLVIGPVVRGMPESWHVPERLAASIVGVDRVAAGARLIGTAAPKTWQDTILGYRIVRKNRVAITRCNEMAAKESKPVRCYLRIDDAKRE
ncbi:MAG: hypothetical protein KGJ79_05185 [Alphaproteobacteria bacterium]|nr:hypothetical protein [Alphaproteobacteria bacterium]MDE2110514.1 hypothetical protein [Alphaproteobacteria bacterium]MDE2493264.1 hypothetical protein [Alphaproteobacteria bacterium]